MRQNDQERAPKAFQSFPAKQAQVPVHSECQPTEQNWPLSIVEGIEEVLFVVDSAWRLTYLNQYALQVFGHPKEALLGQILWETFPTLLSTPFEQFYRRVATEGQPAQIEEFSHTTQTWYEVRAYPIAQGLVVWFRDITARKDLEQSLALQQRLFAQRLVTTQEAERAHLARELHDEVGQFLTGLNILLETALQAECDEQHARLAAAQATLRELTALVRRLSGDLRPPMLDDLGLLDTLHWQFDRYTSQTGIRVQFRHHMLDQPIDAQVAITAYRIVQEALTNVARHAGVAEVHVQVWISGQQLHIQVQDAGHGFDPEALRLAQVSSGLNGMRERVALLGGHWDAVSAPGEGTSIIAVLPCRTVCWEEIGGL